MSAQIANLHGSRLEQRFSIHLAARLHWNRQVYDSFTHDVSRRGLRLLTQCDPAVSFLVKLEVDLPGENDTLTVHAMVVHVTRDEHDLHNRVGMRLYGIGDDDRRRWGRLIDDLARPPAPSPARSQPMRRLQIIDPTAKARRSR